MDLQVSDKGLSGCVAFGHVILEALEEGGRKGSSVQFSRNFWFLVSQRVVKWSQTGGQEGPGPCFGIRGWRIDSLSLVTDCQSQCPSVTVSYAHGDAVCRFGVNRFRFHDQSIKFEKSMNSNFCQKRDHLI